MIFPAETQIKMLLCLCSADSCDQRDYVFGLSVPSSLSQELIRLCLSEVTDLTDPINPF